MSCSTCNNKAQAYKSKQILPFNIDNPVNRSVLPVNKPIIANRPVFPSALPSEFRPSTTNISTNHLYVKKIANISNLRCNSLTVDNGNSSTNVQFRNLPETNVLMTNLVIDNEGNIFRSSINQNGQNDRSSF